MTLLKFSFPVRTASGLWALLLVAATLLLPDHHAVAQQRLQFLLSLPKSAQAEQPKLSRIIADDYEVKTADGRRVKFASLLKKNQPVLIDFWATWCGPCRAEIPHIVELGNKYRDRGLVVIGLTIEDPAEDLNRVKEFAKKYGINYQIAFAPRELYFEFNGRSPRIAIPQTFVYAADGTMIRRIIGYNPKLIPGLLTAAIEEALQQSPEKQSSATQH